jgi:flagellin-like protein
MEMKKRGISPIMATVVLITITVLAGTLIFKFGNDSLKQLSPPADCSPVNFDAGIYQERDNTISFEIINTGNIKIESFILKVKDTLENIETHKINIPVEISESRKETLEFQIQENTIITIIPEIKNTQDKIVQCPEDFEKSAQLKVIEKTNS